MFSALFISGLFRTLEWSNSPKITDLDFSLDSNRNTCTWSKSFNAEIKFFAFCNFVPSISATHYDHHLSACRRLPIGAFSSCWFKHSLTLNNLCTISCYGSKVPVRYLFNWGLSMCSDRHFEELITFDHQAVEWMFVFIWCQGPSLTVTAFSIFFLSYLCKIAC